MVDLTSNASRTHQLVPWLTMLALSILAWILTLQQAWGMFALALPQIGTMGLAFGPFLGYWTLMMVAMMFPALTPVVAMHYQQAVQQIRPLRALGQMLLFLGMYLLPWTLFGVPAFFLARLSEYWVGRAPALSLSLGLMLLLVSGFYQMTPLKQRFLARCNSMLCGVTMSSAVFSLRAQLVEGLTHGLQCLGCCSTLMLIMVAVGLMSVPWMFLLTVVIFLEKNGRHSTRFSFFVGFALLVFAALALAEPALLPGVVQPLTPGLV